MTRDRSEQGGVTFTVKEGVDSLFLAVDQDENFESTVLGKHAQMFITLRQGISMVEAERLKNQLNEVVRTVGFTFLEDDSHFGKQPVHRYDS